jgi:prepilin-type N-terminal cleavage/methylation domain-containing protein
MKRKRQSGFTLIETMAALAIFVAVSAIVVSGMVQMIKTQGTVANRTELHTSVRSATELLQQEIGQAGRISFPTALPPVTITSPIVVATPPLNVPQTVTVTSTANMYVNMLLDVDTGANFEVVTVTSVTPGMPGSIAAVFNKSHNPVPFTAIPVTVSGAFGTGIVPPKALQPCATTGYTGYLGPGTGSDCNTLKLYGDINGDGNIVYVEYSCVVDPTGIVPGYLYRNEVANAIVLGTTKPVVNASMYLLNNVEPNPDGSGCFSYQVQNASVNGVPTPFVTDVALTITVQTQLLDPQTHQYPKETKALLNITPRKYHAISQYQRISRVCCEGSREQRGQKTKQ